MRIEAARQADFDQITALLASSRLPVNDLVPGMLTDFLVLRDEGAVRGVGGLQRFPPYALLRSLALQEVLRGKGLGGELVERLEQHARERHVRTVYLLTTTSERFFSERGYEPTNRQDAPTMLQETAEFQSLCPDTAICMVKAL